MLLSKKVHKIKCPNFQEVFDSAAPPRTEEKPHEDQPTWGFGTFKMQSMFSIIRETYVPAVIQYFILLSHKPQKMKTSLIRNKIKFTFAQQSSYEFKNMRCYSLK